MVSLVGVVGLLIIVAVNSAVAALTTRFFRVRLDTAWGPIVYAVLLTPLALLALTMVMSGVGLGFDLGSPGSVVAVTVLTPLALGLAFDYVWMPAPDEVDLPAGYDRDRDTPRR